MTQDPQAAATKGDIAFLRTDMGHIMETLGTMQQSIFNIEKEAQDSEHRTHILLEELRHDMIGTHTDKIQDHETRIKILEKETGLRTTA